MPCVWYQTGNSQYNEKILAAVADENVNVVIGKKIEKDGQQKQRNKRLDNGIDRLPENLHIKEKHDDGIEQEVDIQIAGAYYSAKQRRCCRQQQESHMQHNAVIIIFAVQEVIEHIQQQHHDDAAYKHLHPVILEVKKVGNAEEREQQYNGPDDVIGLVPGFFVDFFVELLFVYLNKHQAFLSL
jgi:hypothetical protein